jgi:hypothetical protein
MCSAILARNLRLAKAESADLMPDLQRLFSDPDQYLFAFEAQDAAFLPMDRDAYARSIFLDRRIQPKSTAGERLALASLYEAQDRIGAAPSDICYIFHIAHCGSTLLARALDVRDANLVCREPTALRQLGVQAAHSLGKPPDEELRRRTQLAATLLSRRYTANGPVIVKANVPVNFLIAPLMALRPGQPALFLHFSLEHYVLAVLRSSDHAKWLNRVSSELQPGIEAILGTPAAPASPAVQAARLWLAQMAAFTKALDAYAGAASLDAEVFFNAPRETLGACFRHFDQERSARDVEAIVASDLFTRYAKNPNMAYNNDTRLHLQEALRRELGAALAEARRWVEMQPAAARLPKRLAKPLVGDGCDLLGSA